MWEILYLIKSLTLEYVASISFLFFFFFSDPSVIVLIEHDVDDPHVHIDIENIQTYSMEHLQNWLLYRGDTLKGIANLGNSQVKVLQYFKQRTVQRLYDTTPNKKWPSKKARMMGMTLKKML